MLGSIAVFTRAVSLEMIRASWIHSTPLHPVCWNSSYHSICGSTNMCETCFFFIFLFWQASESAARLALSQLSLDSDQQNSGASSGVGKPGTSTLPIPPQQWYQHQQQQLPFPTQTFQHQQHIRQGRVLYKMRCMWFVILWIAISKFILFILGWTVWGSNLGGGSIFCTHLDQPWGPPSLLYNGYWVSFLGVKQLGCNIEHPPHSSAEIKERLGLYFLLHLWAFVACFRMNCTFTLSYLLVLLLWSEHIYSSDPATGISRKLFRLLFSSFVKSWMRFHVSWNLSFGYFPVSGTKIC